VNTHHTERTHIMKMNSRFAKVAVASGLVVATGAAVLGITGFASAQFADNSTAVVSVADDASNGSSSTTSDAAADNAPADGNVSEQNSSATAGESTHQRPQILAAAADALGMTETELVAELKAGKSIKQVADAKNVSLTTVKNAMTAAMKAHLDEEVASGEHTQAEADAKLAEFTTRLDDMVNRVGLPQRGERGGKGGHGPAKFVTANLATVLKLTETELHTQLQSGKSLAQIAQAQNVDIADVKAVLTSDFKAHLDEEVASGEHTQAEADAKLADFTTRLDDMVNGVRPAGGPDGRGGHGGGRRGHGPMGDMPPQDGTAPAQGTSANI
jgi:DNA-binding CsgD family transcriptional regulator